MQGQLDPPTVHYVRGVPPELRLLQAAAGASARMLLQYVERPREAWSVVVEATADGVRRCDVLPVGSLVYHLRRRGDAAGAAAAGRIESVGAEHPELIVLCVCVGRDILTTYMREGGS